MRRGPGTQAARERGDDGTYIAIDVLGRGRARVAGCCRAIASSIRVAPARVRFMKSRSKKKLRLPTFTVRPLDHRTLSDVAGGTNRVILEDNSGGDTSQSRL
jgi:hypothetical protein